MNYTKEQISEIISKHAVQRNGLKVSVFEEQWKYTFNRFYAGFMTFSAIALDFMVLSACLKVA